MVPQMTFRHERLRTAFVWAREGTMIFQLKRFGEKSAKGGPGDLHEFSSAQREVSNVQKFFGT